MSIDASRDRSRPVLGSLTEHASLRARVTDVLREAMIAGELEPGVVYSAPVLAERLGVSATPVREAMMELTQEGLVETLRHRGYRVVEFSDVALDELIELRALIEVPTVGRVAATATAGQIAALRPLADRLTETAENGQLREFIANDMAFHLRLLSIAGNQRLVDEVRRLRGMSRLSALRGLYEEGRLVDTAQEHHALLDRLEAGDAAGSEALMRHHLGHVRGVWAGRAEI
ncbi:GntR family transcriptional regulator [Nocardiopsis sp. L17-MgMaSL7]|uniref:GntR family transcriptional regulator n=1 Tax=Nocardiopsis sp. L17-MgMaSL7 TaxID=1938893 RepID=UPI000D70AF8A|nr:GntR family transcriptional regulator [Nocardiopsis sp. L17-MgMaSL7]PWV58129.1 DNA-binding GntR family transcriptional regulator [Nocardiopsis sp. L17-MgMaSL7]